MIPPNQFATHLPAPTQPTIEQELGNLLAELASRRDQQIFMRSQGWDGGGKQTLRMVADQFAITGERVRQICTNIIAAMRRSNHATPIIERALENVAAQVPVRASLMEAWLADSRFTGCGFTLEMLRDIAVALGRRVPFVIERMCSQTLALPLGMGGAAAVILRAARKCVRQLGAAMVSHVAASVQQQVRIAVGNDVTRCVLLASPDVEWLDEESGWFWIRPISRNFLARRILKVLSVVPRISMNDLHAGLVRTPTRGADSPPLHVLGEACRRVSGCRLEGEIVSAEPGLDPKKLLTDVELKLAQVLQENGNLLPSGRFQELCLAKGGSLQSFYAHRKKSVIIRRYPGNLYGLTGWSNVGYAHVVDGS